MRFIVIFVILVTFFTMVACPVSLAQGGSTALTTGGSTAITTGGSTRLPLRLPQPGVMVHLSSPFDPPVLKGIKVHPKNPFRFDFILDGGADLVSARKAGGDKLLAYKQEATRLIKYFLASITVPEKDLWVNLSPYEKDRIIPRSFGLTEMGRDLLAEDYMLKQMMASLIYPEGETGKKFWERVYSQAQEKYGTTNIPINTFNKVWIVPEKAVVYENAKAKTAYVVEAKLKVMLEQDYVALQHSRSADRLEAEDYLALQKHNNSMPSPNVSIGDPEHKKPGFPIKAFGNDNESLSTLSSQIIRKIVIPQLTKEVNGGKNFSQLRQVFYSLILATWYKKKIKDSILAQVYANKNKVAGIGYDNFPALVGRVREGESYNVEAIYRRYLQAFKKGVFNYIKEEPFPPFDGDPVSPQGAGKPGALIPRKYFSGGVNCAMFGSAANTALQFTDDYPETGISAGGVIIDAEIFPMDKGVPRYVNDLAPPATKSAPLQKDQAMGVDLVKSFQSLSGLPADAGVPPYTPYLHSNEEADDWRSVIYNLSRGSEKKEQRLHMGVSGLQNLDIIASRHSDFGIFLDINPNAIRVVNIVKELFEKNPLIPREQFFSSLIRKLEDDSTLWMNNYYYKKNKKEQIGNLINRTTGYGSWLGNDEAFEYIKRLFLERRIIGIQLNFANYEKIYKIFKWAEENNVTLDTLYISNIFEWNSADNQAKLKSLSIIVQPKTIILSSYSDRQEVKIFLSAFEASDEEGFFKITFEPGRSAEFSDFFKYVLSLPSKDPAMLTVAPKVSKPETVNKTGGIDLTAANINLRTKNRGREIKFYIDPAQLARLSNATGFVPAVINIHPVKSLRRFLEFT